MGVPPGTPVGRPYDRKAGRFHGKTCQAIDREAQDVLDPAVAELIQNSELELRTFTLVNPEAQRLLPAIQADRESQANGFLDDVCAVLGVGHRRVQGVG